jgi:hypothetical protein
LARPVVVHGAQHRGHERSAHILVGHPPATQLERRGLAVGVAILGLGEPRDDEAVDGGLVARALGLLAVGQSVPGTF